MDSKQSAGDVMNGKQMSNVGLIVAALAVAGPAAAQAPVAPIIQPSLPPECRERNVDPEKCVINDGLPPAPIVRKKKAAPPPPPAPTAQEPPPARMTPPK